MRIKVGGRGRGRGGYRDGFFNGVGDHEKPTAGPSSALSLGPPAPRFSGPRPRGAPLLQGEFAKYTCVFAATFYSMAEWGFHLFQ